MVIPLSRLVSFNLHKFSYVTTASLHGPFPWSHLSPPELAVTFEEATNPAGVTSPLDRFVRVHRGPRSLETIYFRTLVQQISEDDASGHLLPDKDRKALILEHRPSIAVRYKLSDGQYRRVQLNFLSTSDFDQAIHLLRESGLPVFHKAIGARDGGKYSNAEVMRPSIGSQVASLPSSQGNPAYARAENVLVYQPSQIGSYGPRPSSEASQWVFQDHSNQYKPVFGPSLIESSMSHQVQFAPAPRQSEPTSLHMQQMHNLASHSAHGLPIHLDRTERPHTVQVPGGDPLRRTLFAEPHNMPESYARPVSALTTNDMLRSHIPPRRELPFSRPASRPATSSSNRIAELAKASPTPQDQDRPEVDVLNRYNPITESSHDQFATQTVPMKTTSLAKVSSSDEVRSPDQVNPHAPSQSSSNRPVTRSFAASIRGDEQPAKKKSKPSHTRPATAKSGTTKSVASKTAKASNPRSSKEVQASATQPKPEIVDHRKPNDLNEAEISTDSCEGNGVFLCIGQCEEKTGKLPKSTKSSQSRKPATVKDSSSSRPAAKKTRDELRFPANNSASNELSVVETQTNGQTPANPTTNSPTTIQTARPAESNRKRTPSPRKSLFKSVGVQTSPLSDENSTILSDVRSSSEMDTAEATQQKDPHTETQSTTASLLVPALDVDPACQALVEAFVLRHHNRIFARSSGPNMPTGETTCTQPTEPLATSESHTKPAPAPALATRILPTTQQSGTSAPTQPAETMQRNLRRESMEQSLAALVMEPGFDALCRDVERVWESLKADAGASGS